MAKPAKLWSLLKPATQKRKLSFFTKQGLSPAQVKSRYNAGTLGSQKAARGKAKTPEHPEDFIKNPEKYKEYRPKTRISTGSREGPALTDEQRKELETLAIRNMDRQLGDRHKYNPLTVRNNVPKMNYGQLITAINAEAEELDDLAGGLPQYRYPGNPFMYH